jgi:hypothetical protein
VVHVPSELATEAVVDHEHVVHARGDVVPPKFVASKLGKHSTIRAFQTNAFARARNRLATGRLFAGSVSNGWIGSTGVFPFKAEVVERLLILLVVGFFLDRLRFAGELFPTTGVLVVPTLLVGSFSSTLVSFSYHTLFSLLVLPLFLSSDALRTSAQRAPAGISAHCRSTSVQVGYGSGASEVPPAS